MELIQFHSFESPSFADTMQRWSLSMNQISEFQEGSGADGKSMGFSISKE